MAFFDPLPDPQTEPDDGPYVARPSSPPVNVVPVTLPDVVVLAKTPTAAVYASGFDVFPQGLLFRVVAVARPDEAARRARAQRWRWPGTAEEVRFGVLLADGTKLFGDGWPSGDRPLGSGPGLVPQGGGGHGVYSQHQYWLWPLPSGPAELVCSWQQYGIEESRGVLDAGDLARVASGARELWPVTQPGWGDAGEPASVVAPLVAGGRRAARRAGTPSPDTRELSVVAAHPCPVCGFDGAEASFGEIPKRLWAEIAAWVRALDGAEVPRHRPQLEVWSLVEHASQIREACLVYARRLRLMLTEDDPQFPAVTGEDAAERYQFSDPDAVARDVIEAAETMIAALESVRPDQLGRTGRRANGERYTVDSLARYVLHDVVHHSRAAGIS